MGPVSVDDSEVWFSRGGFVKIGFFENLVKIGFWGGFGSIWAPESSSA